MRYQAPGPLILMLLLLVSACGGGSRGGGVTTSGEPAPPPNPSVSTRIEDILEACVLEGIGVFETAMSGFEPVLDRAGTPNPDFQVTGVDVLGASLTWTLDADADGAVDLSGTMRFLNGSGAPSWPFNPVTLLALLAGTADLPSLLATLPDGTTIAIDYVTVGSPVPVSGSLLTSFVAGQPASASGEASFLGTSCQTGITFSDLPAASLYDSAPTGVFDLLVSTAGDVLQGTLTLNGDGTATIDVGLDDTNRAVWDYDLATGILTPRP